jgi:hypothetical protein
MLTVGTRPGSAVLEVPKDDDGSLIHQEPQQGRFNRHVVERFGRDLGHVARRPVSTECLRFRGASTVLSRQQVHERAAQVGANVLDRFAEAASPHPGDRLGYGTLGPSPVSAQQVGQAKEPPRLGIERDDGGRVIARL